MCIDILASAEVIFHFRNSDSLKWWQKGWHDANIMKMESRLISHVAIDLGLCKILSLYVLVAFWFPKFLGALLHMNEFS